MKILVDMNLSPAWAGYFASEGWESVHWSAVGDPRAPDTAILEWARVHGFILFTHDLDFGSILAASGSGVPSVLQVRAQDVLPTHLGGLVASVIRQNEGLLLQGGFVTFDEGTTRVRILPLPG